MPLEQVSSAGVVQYLHQDERGSTRAVTDSLGASVATYDYDPYGKGTAKTGSATTPLQFAAQYADGESGLAYRGSRYYDPATAQHISRAPSELLSGNPYADPPGGDPAAGGDTPPPATGGDGPTPKPPPRIVPAAGYPDDAFQDDDSGHCDFGLFCAVPDIADALIGDPVHNPLDALALFPLLKGLKIGGLAVRAAGRLFRAGKEGREIRIGQDLRVAPFGNRRGHPSGRWPHYHRRGANDPATWETMPGQGRHRPWEPSRHDRRWRDRF